MEHYHSITKITDPKLHYARVKYAALVYEEFTRRGLDHEAALFYASQYGHVKIEAVKSYLPDHKREMRIIRNQKIINMRASGYSVKAISELMEINRSTIERVISKELDKEKAVKHYLNRKLPPRLSDDDPRLYHGDFTRV